MGIVALLVILLIVVGFGLYAWRSAYSGAVSDRHPAGDRASTESPRAVPAYPVLALLGFLSFCLILMIPVLADLFPWAILACAVAVLVVAGLTYGVQRSRLKAKWPWVTVFLSLSVGALLGGLIVVPFIDPGVGGLLINLFMPGGTLLSLLVLLPGMIAGLVGWCTATLIAEQRGPVGKGGH